MVPIRYWRMVLGNVTPKASDRDVEVQKISPRYKRGTDNKPTDEIEGYNISFIAIKGTDQNVKLPLSAKPAVEELQKLLSDGQSIIRIKFNNLTMRAYALNSSDGLLTGISASADGFEITSIEKPDVEEALIDFE